MNKRQRQGRVQTDAHPGRSVCVQSAALKDAKASYSSELAWKLHQIRPDLSRMLRTGLISSKVAESVLGKVDHDGREMSFIYFIQGVEGGLVKIGRATNVLKRLEQIQRSSPVQLRILAVAVEDIYPEDGTSNELDLHQLFADSRLWGEWFRPTEFLMQFIHDARITGRT